MGSRRLRGCRAASLQLVLPSGRQPFDRGRSHGCGGILGGGQGFRSNGEDLVRSRAAAGGRIAGAYLFRTNALGARGTGFIAFDAPLSTRSMSGSGLGDGWQGSRMRSWRYILAIVTARLDFRFARPGPLGPLVRVGGGGTGGCSRVGVGVAVRRHCRVVQVEDYLWPKRQRRRIHRLWLLKRTGLGDFGHGIRKEGFERSRGASRAPKEKRKPPKKKAWPEHRQGGGPLLERSWRERQLFGVVGYRAERAVKLRGS